MVNWAEPLFVETICCMDQQWRIAICILVVRRSDFRPWRSLILDDLLWCVRVCAQCVCVCVHMLCLLDVSTCAHAPDTRIHSVMRVVTSLADMRKGQECHFCPTWLSVEGDATCCHWIWGQREPRQVTGGQQYCQNNSVTKHGDVVFKNLIKLQFILPYTNFHSHIPVKPSVTHISSMYLHFE